MENLIAVHRPSAAPIPAPACLPAPVHRHPPTQYANHVTRAYRLGKSETLSEFYDLLAANGDSARALQYAIVGRMHELSTQDPNTLLGPKNLHKFQECQGVADACTTCFDLIATQKFSGAALSRRIADRLRATWPSDYQKYRRRCLDRTGEDLTVLDEVDCLDLRAWYAAVDDLYREVACMEAAGLPPSEDQERMEALLLHTAGEALPCAE